MKGAEKFQGTIRSWLSTELIHSLVHQIFVQSRNNNLRQAVQAEEASDLQVPLALLGTRLLSATAGPARGEKPQSQLPAFFKLLV